MSNKIKTSCQYCEFRKGLDCEFSLHDNIEKEVCEHDGDKFVVINNFCMFRRPSGWKEAKKELLCGNKTYLDIALDELKIDLTLLVFIHKNAKESEIKETINEINSMSPMPSSVIFMNHSKIEPLFFFDGGCKFNWSCEQILFDKKTRKNLLRQEAENICSKKVNTVYFCVVDSDKVNLISKDIVNQLKQRIILNDEKFLCLSNKPGLPIIYQSKTFKFIRGHLNEHAIRKLKVLTRVQKCKNLVKKMS